MHRTPSNAYNACGHNRDLRPTTISPTEPITDLRHVPIRECGEEMVDFLDLCPALRLDRPRFTYRRETLARRRVAEMLCAAQQNLPDGYHLAVVEGWRAPHIQKRMYLGVWRRAQTMHPDWSEVKLRRYVNRYTAPYDAKNVPPPHSTGGAVDVILVRADGSPYDHTTPFKRLDDKCFAFDAPGLSEEARTTRRILAEALLPTGLTNYPSEYWHWSFGDQGWAYRGGHEAAVYGPILPENWEPAAEDLVEEPLVLLEY